MTAVHLLMTLLEHFGLTVLVMFLLLSCGAIRKLVISKIFPHAGCECNAVLDVFAITGTYAETVPMSAVANLEASGALFRRVRR